MLDFARDLRLPDVVAHPEYEQVFRGLTRCASEHQVRTYLRTWYEHDRYAFAVLLGYDDAAHPWDPFHLWQMRVRIPELRAIPGCQSLWLQPRGTYKTAIEEVDTAWEICYHPERTQAIGSWKLVVARRITSQVKRLLERPVLVWLFPDVLWESPSQAPLWTTDAILVKRRGSTKDPTLSAFSIESPPTSLHVDLVRIDDAVERRNAFTEEGIQKVKDTLRDVRNYRVNDASQIEVRGTLWDPQDWHCSVLMKSPDWIVERHPAIVEDPAQVEDPAPPPPGLGLKPGDLLYPSTKTREALERDEREMGSWHFGGQVLLRMQEAEGAFWTREMVQNYWHPDDYPLSWRAYCFVDLAKEDAQDPDDTAISVWITGSGSAYPLILVAGWAGQFSPEETARRLYEVYEAWGSQTWIEEIGLAAYFEVALRQEAARKGYMLPHTAVTHRGAGFKVKERIKTCDPFFRARRIFSRDPATVEDPDQRQFFLKYEYQAMRWPKVAHDDILDTVTDACLYALPADTVQPDPEAALRRRLPLKKPKPKLVRR